MDMVPAYLGIYLLRIRRHGSEQGYLGSRFEKMGSDKMLIEVQMLEDLERLGLVRLSSKKLEKVFNPHVVVDANGAIIHRACTEVTVMYPSLFVLRPAGKHFITEALFQAASKTAWSVIVALIGVLVGIAIGGLGDA